MIWDVIDFICRETALNLRRERLIAIATISTVAVLLLVLGGAVLLLLDVRLWTNRMAQELEVSGYFQRDLPSSRAREIAEEIGSWPEVASATFVSKEEGWRWLQGRLSDTVSLEGIDNPLPDKVSVRVRAPDSLQQVAEKIEAVPEINDVVPSAARATAAGSFAHRVLRVKRAVTWAGIAISLLVTTAGVFIVHNTIRLALHSRWREIYIMQLVGATRAVVAAPFILEGAIHGALGATLAGCVILPAHMYIRVVSARSAPFFLLAPDRILLPFGLYLIAGGILLGVTGSLVSLRRFLRRRPGWYG